MYRIVMISALWVILTAGAPIAAQVGTQVSTPFGVLVDAALDAASDAPASAPLGALADAHVGVSAVAPFGVPVGGLESALEITLVGISANAPAIAPAVAQVDVALYAPESTQVGTPANAPVGTTAVALAVTLEGIPAGAPEVASAVAPAFTPQNTLKVTQVNTPEVALLNAPLAVPLAVPIVAPAVTPLKNAPAFTPAFTPLKATPEQPSLLRTDSLTYALYLNKEWKALLTETRRALSEGIDFYYLRVRAGIAAYELKDYRLAAWHLAKAYEWNTSDELVNYWYYYALLMGSRADEANALSEIFPPQFLQRMEIRPKRGVNSLTAEGQVSVNTDHASLLEDAIGGSSYLAYRNVLKRQIYKGFGIDHRVAPRLYAFHGISHLGIDRMQMYRSPTLDYQVESSAWQFQYYLQGRYLLPKGWSVTSSATLLLGSARSHWLSFSNAGVPIRNASTYSISDGFVSASVAKELTRWRPKFSVAYGKVRGYRQFQTTGQLLLYPAGNPNFYLSASYTLHRDESNPDLKTIFSPRAGLKTGPLWWSAGGSTGVMKHFSASDGYVVYNMNESISGLYDISVYLPLLKYRLGVTARYQVAEKEGSTFDYSNATRYTTAPYTYTENSFLISIRYNL